MGKRKGEKSPPDVPKVSFKTRHQKLGVLEFEKIHRRLESVKQYYCEFYIGSKSKNVAYRLENGEIRLG